MIILTICIILAWAFQVDRMIQAHSKERKVWMDTIQTLTIGGTTQKEDVGKTTSNNYMLEHIERAERQSRQHGDDDE